MGKDVTSITYPYSDDLNSDNSTGEGHSEDGTNIFQTSVVFADHPQFGPNSAKDLLNFHRRYGNNNEDLLTGDIPVQVFKDLSNAAYKAGGFPMDMLMFAADAVQKLDERSGASDAAGIIQQLQQAAQQLQSSFNRQPTYGEVFGAFLSSASQIQQITQQALSNPNQVAQGGGGGNSSIDLFSKVKDFVRTVDQTAQGQIDTQNNNVGSYMSNFMSNFTDGSTSSTQNMTDKNWQNLGPDGGTKQSPDTETRTWKQILRFLSRRIRNGNLVFAYQLRTANQGGTNAVS